MALNEDDQMDAVFKSSRTDVDPVSGNEVPPGSLPEEVRDDIPAQLSEGEYVVPADVLRFYGMKFFEDLRKEAKMELARMDAEGRIGGEPMGEMEEGDLTPEEMAEIETMMMAVGGFATQQDTQSTQPDPYQQQQMMYRQGAPVAVGNAGYNQGGEVRGYAPGGDVVPMPTVPEPTTPAPAGTQANIDFSQFGAGFSFSPQAQQNLQQIGQATQAQPAFTPVKMYAPDGTEVTANTLEEYNNYLTQGYTLAPPAVKPSDDDGTPPTDTEPKDPTSWADDLDFTDSDQVKAAVDEMLGLSKGDKTAAGMGLLGAAFVGINKVTGVARSNAIANILEKGSTDQVELARQIREKIRGVEDSALLKLIPDEVHNGSMLTKQLEEKYGNLENLIVKNAMPKSKEFYKSLTSLGAGDVSTSKAIQDEETVMSQQVGNQGSGSTNDDNIYVGPDGRHYDDFEDYVAADTAKKAAEAEKSTTFQEIMAKSKEETGLAGD